jgi:glucose/arabinose dehydrogenase
MRNALFVGIAGIVAWLTATTPSNAALSGTSTQVGSGLFGPTFATFAPGDNNHLFVLEQTGAIKVVDLTTKSVLATPFLIISDTDPASEGGLLGLAFHPDYAMPGSTGFGKFYVYVTVDNGGLPVPAGDAPTATSPFSTHIRQYSVSTNPLVANPSPTEILSFPRPLSNHVGGWIGFGPNDGYLYINSGDGGNGNDVGPGHFEPGGNAQTLTNNLFGKQLRIDINGDDFTNNTPEDMARNYAVPPTNPFVGATGDDEIWSYGLRNPFRSSFDRDTGDFWTADVGQSAREEINFEPAQRTGVPNYGWRLREGNIPNPDGSVGGPPPPGYVAPVHDYDHSPAGGAAVIGGYVYRGPDPSLQGKYFFGDEISSHFWMMDTTTFAVQNIDDLLAPDVGEVTGPSSFAEDAVGNLYIVTYFSGAVFRINTNQLLAGDYNANGTVDAADYVVWRNTLGSATTLAADGNNNGAIDSGDFAVWQANFGITVHPSSPSGGATVPEPCLGQAVLLLLAIVHVPRNRPRAAWR